MSAESRNSLSFCAQTKDPFRNLVKPLLSRSRKNVDANEWTGKTCSKEFHKAFHDRNDSIELVFSDEQMRKVRVIAAAYEVVTRRFLRDKLFRECYGLTAFHHMEVVKDGLFHSKFSFTSNSTHDDAKSSRFNISIPSVMTKHIEEWRLNESPRMTAEQFSSCVMDRALFGHIVAPPNSNKDRDDYIRTILTKNDTRRQDTVPFKASRTLSKELTKIAKFRRLGKSQLIRELVLSHIYGDIHYKEWLFGIDKLSGIIEEVRNNRKLVPEWGNAEERIEFRLPIWAREDLERLVAQKSGDESSYLRDLMEFSLLGHWFFATQSRPR